MNNATIDLEPLCPGMAKAGQHILLKTLRGERTVKIKKVLYSGTLGEEIHLDNGTHFSLKRIAEGTGWVLSAHVITTGA